jgi:hypothetical protein
MLIKSLDVSRAARCRTWRAALLLLPALVLPAGLARGQTLQTGTIIGTVRDNQGGAAAQVTVTLTSPVLITARTDSTNAEGSYRFPSLPPGVYALSYELTGFRKASRTNVLVDASVTRTIDVTLEVGAISETVEVVGEAGVDVTDTNIATSLDTNALQNIPTARDVWSILQNMAPQVVLDREDVGGSEGGLQAVFSSHGSTWRQNTYALNGVNVTDPAATGAAGFYYDYDSFEQVQISTAQHAAEVGTPGVYYNFVAKSGTNEFHGAAAYYFENDSLVSDNVSDDLRDQGITSGAGINLFSDATFQLGGPIVRDKLRFFTSWRDWRIHRDVPNFPQSENTDLFSGLVNLSYQVNPKNRLDVLGTIQTYYKPNRNASAQVPPDSTWIEDDVFRIFQGHYNAQIGNAALFDARISFSNVDFPLKFQEGVTEQNTTELTTGNQTGAAPQSFAFYRERLAGELSLNYFKADWLGADHDFRVGYQYGRQVSESEANVIDGVTLNVFEGEPNFLIAYNTPVLTESRYTDNVLFVQDSITHGNLTVNLGLRYENTKGVLPAQSSPAGPFAPARSFPAQDVISWSDLAPRAGVIWDVGGKHRTAVKVGFGRYFHQLSPDPIEAPSPNNLGGTGFTWNDLNGDLQAQPGEQGDFLFSFGGSSITTVDEDLRRPRTDEVTAGMEFQLPHDIVLNVEGILRWGSQLLATTEVGIPANGYSTTSALDPGPDGSAGTADDQTVTVFNLLPEFVGASRRLVTNPEGFETSFKGLEVTLQKRFSNGWQGLVGYSISEDDLSRAGTSFGVFGGGEEESAGAGNGGGFTDPNQAINNNGGPSVFDRRHSLKMSGSYEIRSVGMNVAAVYKVQSGVPAVRLLTASEDVNGVPFNQGPITFYAEERGTRRIDTIHYMDFRVSKYFDIRSDQRLELILDVFNLFNQNTVTGVNGNTGSDFLNPLTILGPRVFRLGARFVF